MTVTLDLRVCRVCGEAKPESAFYKAKYAPGGITTECRVCCRARMKARADTMRPELAHRARVDALRRFDLTIEEYDRMFEEQLGLCRICDQPETGTYRGKIRRLSVDHDHLTGKVCGLLCTSCNTKLGWYEHFVPRVEEYLRGHAQAAR